MARVLVLDDDIDVLRLFALYLTPSGHEVSLLLKPSGVMEEIRQFKPDVVITDILMPGITGGIVYQEIRARIGPTLPVIICSGTKMELHLPDDPWLAYCSKPVDFKRLESLIQRFVSAREALQQNKAMADQEKPADEKSKEK